MRRTSFTLRRLCLGLLIAGIGSLTLAAPADEHDRQIEAIEKQIAELQAKLEALNGRELLPAPKEVTAGVPESWVAPMKWRCIGPANMGGRITGLAVCESDPTTYWVATASGGLIKTTNNGVTFEHQFDRQATASIGAVAVAPSDKNVVWVGTGEANPRNSVSWGDGVYKSADGGKTWKNMGLRQSFQIGKIVIHPKNPDVVYVGALGRLYGPNPERGLFKTTDGGKTWAKVLFIDDNTGVIDLTMNPADPETLLVAAWERRRDEFDSFRGDAKHPPGADDYAPVVVHGPGSALYKTTDGGKTFQKLTKGLPSVKLGRIGIDFSRKNPDVAYAIIDTEKIGAGDPPPPEPEVGYLGVATEDDKGGVKLTAVSENSPAEKAGLKAGDVLTHLGEQVVKNEADFLARLRKMKPGEKARLTVMRGKETKAIEATLGNRPTKKGGPPVALGVAIAPAQNGALVTEVTAKGPAEKVGLKPDDLITHIDGVAASDRRVIAKALFGKKPGDKVKVTYVRGKETKDVEVTLDVVKVTPPGRPNAHAQLGGQVANAQGWQGPEGVNTGGVFRSTDRGETWTRVNSLDERPFYFSVVRVDPADENTVYALGVDLRCSTDGGKKFSPDGINAGVHADQHDLWIDPHNNRHLLIGTDGGFYVSYDKAANWEHLNRLALGQFYHVAADNRRPYRVYGGLQDNGSWGGPSNTRRATGPVNEDWVYVAGGDGFVCRVDSSDPDVVYAESQDGNMMRRDLRTGASAFVVPPAVAGLGRYRFNWNTPFILSHHNPRIFYSAGNYVFRSVSRGDAQRPISPEITRTKRGSATALAESPRNPEVLWVGTDDGAVHLTRDGGRTWKNLTESFRPAGVPRPHWVASIEASRWEEGRAYVVFDGHRSDDDRPYVFVTEDYGGSWRPLHGGLPVGSTRVLREDLVSKELLYLGTEFAAHASIDRGATWFKLNGTTLPTVAIHEFAQPTTANEICVATHGRSLWVLDVAALRQFTPALAAGKAPKLLTPSPAVRWQIQPGGTGPFSVSQRKFVGQNPPRGALIDFVLPVKAARVALKVTDVEGKTVAELKAGDGEPPLMAPGLHRVVWDLRVARPPRPKDVGDAELSANPLGQLLFGTAISAGTYRVVLTADGQEQSAPLVVEGDPNAPPAVTAAVDEVEEERVRRRLEKNRP
jgi:photosystem II stability/assembly factor-like uncharacterized protein